MSAQEEIEKLEQEMRGYALASIEPPHDVRLVRWADRIAAIRDGLGKAKEPVRWMCPDHGDVSRVQRVGWLPLYREAPPADSAQVLVEARNITKIERLGDQTVSVTLASCRAASALEKALTDYHAQVTGEALAAHKSEVKG